MKKVLNIKIREFCRVTKGVYERIDESVLQWFEHVERMENDRVAKSVYAKECAYICLAQWVNHGRGGLIP